MAKIVAEFDTVAKTLTVMEDGTEVSNVSAAYFYLFRGWDDESKFGCEVRTAVMDKDNKVTRTNVLYASENTGLVEEKNTLQKAIASYINARRGK